MIKRYSFYTFLVFFFLNNFSAQAQLQVDFSAANSPELGGQFDVDVRVSDFDQLFGAQFAVVWDSLVMEIDTVLNLSTDLPDLNQTAFTLPNETSQGIKGRLRLSWFFGGAPQSLPDDHLLFTMRFNIVGLECDETTIALMDLPSVPIEVSDQNFNNIGAVWNELPVMIPGAGCVDPTMGVELVFTNDEVEPGASICIPLTVNNFDTMETLQGSVMWDPAILMYTGLQNFGLPGLNAGTFNTTEAANGSIGFFWFDSTGETPVTLDDGTTIFEICFDVVGSAGQSTIIKPFDGVVPLQASSPAPVGVKPVVAIQGIISIADEPRELFSVIAEDIVINGSESEVCVDFTTDNFIDIAGMQFTMQWDSTVLAYNRIETVNSEYASSFNLAGADRLRYVWTHSLGTGRSEPDGTVIYSVCFDVLGDCEDATPINFIGEPGREIEITDNTFTSLNPADVNLVDGSVTIACVLDCSATITDVRCNGEASGAINVVVMGGTAPYDIVWASGETQDDFSSNTLLVGQTAGNYIATITDDIGETEVCGPYIIAEPDPIVLTVNVSDMVVTASATGGNGGINITYDPAIADLNNVAPGTYTVTATDSRGCTETEMFTVQSEECVITITQTIFSASCGPDGRILVTCSGGSGSYNVSSNPSLTFSTTENAFINVPAGTYEITCQDAADATCSETVTVTVLQSVPDLMAQISNVTNAECNGPGGTFDVSPSGGCPPYSITVASLPNGTPMSYSPTTEYPAGNYTVTVTDDTNNMVELPLTIIQDAASAIEISSVDILPAACTGMEGQATFTIMGGCGDATCQVSFSGGAPVVCNLTVNSNGSLTGDFPQGTHTITFTDSFTGSSDTETFTIGVSSNALNVTVLEIDKETGTIDIQPEGGIPPYSFQYILDGNLEATTEDITGATPGDYTIIILDAAGCSISVAVELPGPGGNDVASISLNPVDQPWGGFATPCSEGDCMGIISGVISGAAPFTIVLTNESAIDFTYTFDNEGVFSIEELCAGSYEVLLTDSNGSTDNVDSAIEISAPAPLLLEEDSKECPSEGQSDGSISVAVSGGVGGYVYNWTPESSEPIPGPNNENLSVGMYTLDVQDNNGCESSITIDLLTDCTDSDCYLGRRVITPNGDGANDVFAITCSDGEAVAIFDRWSRLVFETSSYGNDWNGIDMEGVELPEGAYYWVLRANSNTYKGTVTLLRD